MDSLEISHLVARALMAKKAQDPLILDLRGLTIIADYFVIATGTSTPHLNALIDSVLETAKAHGLRNIRCEGSGNAAWVLLDLGDVVVHVFNEEQRDFYKLERLWADAERVPLPEDDAA